MFCGLCGQHARHPKSPVADLRRKACPRFPGGVIHRGCCAQETCSEIDARGHVLCGWERGGKERLQAAAEREAGVEAALTCGASASTRPAAGSAAARAAPSSGARASSGSS